MINITVPHDLTDKEMEIADKSLEYSEAFMKFVDALQETTKDIVDMMSLKIGLEIARHVCHEGQKKAIEKNPVLSYFEIEKRITKVLIEDYEDFKEKGDPDE